MLTGDKRDVRVVSADCAVLTTVFLLRLLLESCTSFSYLCLVQPHSRDVGSLANSTSVALLK